MTAVFADALFYLALLNPRDEFHVDARDLTTSLHRPLVTSEFILVEVADGLARTSLRSLAWRLWERLERDPGVTIIPATTALLSAARRLYRRRPDKAWSLTDCTSFVIMRESRMTDALTADRHFAQAGFNPLLGEMER